MTRSSVGSSACSGPPWPNCAEKLPRNTRAKTERKRAIAVQHRTSNYAHVPTRTAPRLEPPNRQNARRPEHQNDPPARGFGLKTTERFWGYRASERPRDIYTVVRRQEATPNLPPSSGVLAFWQLIPLFSRPEAGTVPACEVRCGTASAPSRASGLSSSGRDRARARLRRSVTP